MAQFQVGAGRAGREGGGGSEVGEGGILRVPCQTSYSLTVRESFFFPFSFFSLYLFTNSLLF